MKELLLVLFGIFTSQVLIHCDLNIYLKIVYGLAIVLLPPYYFHEKD